MLQSVNRCSIYRRYPRKPIAARNPSDRAPSTRFAVSPPPGITAIASATSAMMPMLRAVLRLTASRIARDSRPGRRSALLDDDRLEHVGGRLARVDRLLDPLEYVLPADYHHRVDAVRKEGRERLARDPVTFVLEAVHLDQLVVEVAGRMQLRQRHGEVPAGLAQHRAELLRLLHGRLYVVQPEEVGRLFGVVDDVVERRGERVHVLAVDGRRDLVVEQRDHVVRDAIALLLADQDLAAEALLVGPLAQEAIEQLGGTVDVRTLL